MINMAMFREALHGAPIVPVLTVTAVEHAAPLASALISGGLRSAEVTLRTPVALEVIAEMKSAEPNLVVGAGTIISEGDVDAALKAGADFLVSPGAGPDLLKALAYHDGVILPGVSTASEAMSRFEEGYGVLKFFPAEAAGGANFIKSICGNGPASDFRK
ncbi:MAG: keto-deoxy-phosphogluconate aldolase, partial [Pseudomonadota bacterium]